MEASSILDRNSLLADLRLAAGYASRAGLLSDPALLDRLRAVESDSLTEGNSVNPHALTIALNDLAQVIQPMTLADLRCGRDPFERASQRRARTLQFWLAILALCTMGVIGHSMSALGAEKAGLQAMLQLQLTQPMQPMQQINALRRMAQLEDPLAHRDASSELYRQRLAEWAAQYQARSLIDVKMDNALNNSFLPGSDWVLARWNAAVDRWSQTAASSGSGTSSGQAPASAEPSQQPTGASAAIQKTAMSSSSADRQPQPSKPSVASDQGGPAYGDYDEACRLNESGAITLPDAMADNPSWLKRQQAELINDFCFQFRVLLPITGGLNFSAQNIGRVGQIPGIEYRVAVRSNWILPLLFGMLGATIFVMRNIANVRTPAMELFPMFMRISLGGVAGIVVGWFATPAVPGIEATNALSVPFALAFLTGYGIDALFSVLDRLSRVAAPGAQPSPH